jgi:multicomponent Na+:H+ antiporter subunit B
MTDHTILRVVSKVILPYVLLFGLYVQFHGDYGPGGGFQAGVIFAAGFVLYGLIYGLAAVRRVAPPRVIEILVALGVLLYAGTGVLTMLRGGNFLDYGALNPLHPAEGQHLGILVVELGVGITVASVMIAIYSTFAGRGRA